MIHDGPAFLPRRPSTLNHVFACPEPPTRAIFSPGADNAMCRRFAPRAAIIMRSGCEDIRSGDRLE
jgi:hypothetical protein